MRPLSPHSQCIHLDKALLVVRVALAIVVAVLIGVGFVAVY